MTRVNFLWVYNIFIAPDKVMVLIIWRSSLGIHWNCLTKDIPMNTYKISFYTEIKIPSEFSAYLELYIIFLPHYNAIPL